MFSKIRDLIKSLDLKDIDQGRLETLDKLVQFLQKKVDAGQAIHLNFICTHNSRRSHLAQIWSQVFSKYYDIPLVFCYSGGTEATAIYPTIIETLEKQGFEFSIRKKKKHNPKYYICYSDKYAPIIGFSKRYDDSFNPKQDFAAIMTCNDADKNCPIVIGASERFTLDYEDPKLSDGTEMQEQTYLYRSLEIAKEAKYIFSNIRV